LLLYVLAEPLGFTDFLLMATDPDVAKGVGFDGTMSPNVAAGFTLVGIAMLQLSAPRIRPWTITPCVALLLTLSCLALVSYVTGLSPQRRRALCRTSRCQSQRHVSPRREFNQPDVRQRAAAGARAGVVAAGPA